MKRANRNVLSLENKLKIIKEVEMGEKISTLAKRHGMNESSVRTLRLNSEKIKNSIACSTTVAAKTVKRFRPSIMEKMEGILSVWV